MSAFTSQKFASDLDKTGAVVGVHYSTYETLPVEVVSGFLRHWANLIENGHALSTYVPPLVKSRFVYLTIDGQLVAFIGWEWLSANTTYILYAGVEPEYRQRGLYMMCHKYYEKILRENNQLSIVSKTSLSVANNIVVDAATKNGYTTEYLRMTKKVK